MADTIQSAFSNLDETTLALGDFIPLRDVSDVSMAATGTNKEITVQDLKDFYGLPSTIYNASVSAVGPAFGSDTYIVGSSIAIPAGRLQAKSMYRCKFNLVKAAAGIPTVIVNVRFGTNGSTADTSRGTLTHTVGTAVADEGLYEFFATFNTVGSGTSAVLQSVGIMNHRLSVTGLTGTGAVSEPEIATSGGFDSTVGSSIIGLSLNVSASTATISLVQAELFNLV